MYKNIGFSKLSKKLNSMRHQLNRYLPQSSAFIEVLLLHVSLEAQCGSHLLSKSQSQGLRCTIQTMRQLWPCKF